MNNQVQQLIDGKLYSNQEYDIIGTSDNLTSNTIQCFNLNIIPHLDKALGGNNRTVICVLNPAVFNNSVYIFITRYYPVFNLKRDDRNFRLSDCLMINDNLQLDSPISMISFFKQVLPTPRLEKKENSLNQNIDLSRLSTFDKSNVHNIIHKKIIRGFLKFKKVFLLYPDFKEKNLHLDSAKIPLLSQKMVIETIEALDLFPLALKKILTVQFNYIHNTVPDALIITAPRSERIEKLERRADYSKLSFPKDKEYVSEANDDIELTDTESKVLNFILKREKKVNKIFSGIGHLKEGWISKEFVFEGIQKIKFAILTEELHNKLQSGRELEISDLEKDYIKFLISSFKSDDEAYDVLTSYYILFLSQNKEKWLDVKEEIVALNSSVRKPKLPLNISDNLKRSIAYICGLHDFHEYKQLSELFSNLTLPPDGKPIVEKTIFETILDKSISSLEDFNLCLDYLSNKSLDEESYISFLRKNQKLISAKEFIARRGNLLDFIPNEVYIQQADSFKKIISWKSLIPTDKYNQIFEAVVNQKIYFNNFFNNFEDTINLLYELQIEPSVCEELLKYTVEHKNLSKENLRTLLLYTNQYMDFRIIKPKNKLRLIHLLRQLKK